MTVQVCRSNEVSWTLDLWTELGLARAVLSSHFQVSFRSLDFNANTSAQIVLGIVSNKRLHSSFVFFVGLSLKAALFCNPSQCVV